MRPSSNHVLPDVSIAQLWKLLRPGVILQGRITSQWGEIGFQGDDPATDFRGNGLLGLANLVRVASGGSTWSHPPRRQSVI